MNLQPLYEVQERLEHAAIAGTGLLDEDFRLKRAWAALAPLAAASPERIAFLQGARALYYEETMELMSQAVAVGISKILPGGDRNGE